VWPRASSLLCVVLFFGVDPPGAAAGLEAFALDDLKWTDRRADRGAALTRAPSECVARPPDPSRAAWIALGRIAFRSPILLGGVAARSGMRCDTCHRNGHGNPAFFIDGVSSESGTADVTGSLFSRSRDDGVSNPVPIPSLVDAASNPPFGSVAPKADLRDFLIAVVVDEFQGPLPPSAVTEGLLAYLGALRSTACPAHAVEAVEALARTRDALRRVIRELRVRASQSFYDPEFLEEKLLEAN